MPSDNKLESVAEIKERFSRASAVILADYRGLTVKDMQLLRVKMREQGCEVKVYKNSLTQIALRELAMPDLGAMLQGPTAFTFAFGDPVAPAKAMMAFAKDHKVLEVKGGIIERQVVGSEGVKALASLPSREELIAKLLGTMINPIVGFARVLNGPVEAFARTVQAVADQKAAA